MNKLGFRFEYEWKQFKANGRHLTFHDLETNRVKLAGEECSQGGAVIYKWEGTINEGEHQGKTGILIGETDDVRVRLNQYKSGTQKHGNLYWRNDFLKKGNICFWVINLKECFLGDKMIDPGRIKCKNFRLVVEQLLVLELLHERDKSKTWVVNRMQ